MKRIFAHRYKWSHDKIRKNCLRKVKEGKLRLVSQNKEGWLYEEI